MKLDVLLIALASSGVTILALALPLDAVDGKTSLQDIAERDAGDSGSDSGSGTSTLIELPVRPALGSGNSQDVVDSFSLLGRSPGNALEATSSTPASASPSSAASSPSSASSSSSKYTAQGIAYLRKLMGPIARKFGMTNQQAHDAQKEMEQMLEADAARGQQKTNQLNARDEGDREEMDREWEAEREQGEMAIVRRVQLQAGQSQVQGEQMQAQLGDAEDESRLLKREEDRSQSLQSEGQGLKTENADREEESDDGGFLDEQDVMSLANAVQAWKRSDEGQDWEAFRDLDRMGAQGNDATEAIEKRAWQCAV